MACEDALQTFGMYHLERLVESQYERDRRRPRGRMLVALELQLARQIEVVARSLGFARSGQRAIRQRDHCETRRQHERLLAAGYERVDAPFIHPLLEDSDRGDAVDDQHHVAPA